MSSVPFRPIWSTTDEQLTALADVFRGAIEPADWRSPMAADFDIPFTRVRTSREGVLGDFRLCVGGRLSMRRVRERSLDLRRALQDFAASAVTGGSVLDSDRLTSP